MEGLLEGRREGPGFQKCRMRQSRPGSYSSPEPGLGLMVVQDVGFMV